MSDSPAPAAPVARALAEAVIRKVLTVIGTAAVSRGLIDQGTVDGSMGEVVELVLGTVIACASAVWTWLSTTDVHARLEAALVALRARPPAAMPTIPSASPEATPSPAGSVAPPTAG